MASFHRDILEHTDAGERVASAVIVSTRGSTPQEIGARMLFFQDGSASGTVGGGCVEADVRSEAMRVLADGQTRYVEVDLGDDVRGEGDVCGGTVEFLLEAWEAPEVAAT